MGKPTPKGYRRRHPGGGLLDSLNGEAIGQIETVPLVLSLPVRVASGDRIHASLELGPDISLKPGATYSLPPTFIALYRGDFYEPLRLYSSILQRKGSNPAKPRSCDYQVSWCGWGYESEVTPAQMTGTIPKLKEFHVRWATLDDRWFDNYGDWNPRPDTFPDRSIQKMVNAFHHAGISVQIWWLPLEVEDGEGHDESHRYGMAEVVKKHPDWLILDKNGKPAHIVRGLAALCSALLSRRCRNITGSWLGNSSVSGHSTAINWTMTFTVPPCYNPKHHHKRIRHS